MNQPVTLDNQRTWPTNGVFRVPGWVYTDPEIFEKEMERFHHGPTWNLVGLECEIPEPGSWKRGSVGLRSVIVVRDETNEIRVLENRCTHRGAPICWKIRGNDNRLTCPYHQWWFNLQGDLMGVPFQGGLGGAGGMPEEFDKSQNGLRRLKTVVRGGAIWASFSEEVVDFETYCGPELIAALDRITSKGKLKLLGTSRHVHKSNWKMWLENGRDVYHATLLHTFLTAFKLVRADLPPPKGSLRDGHSIGVFYTQPEEIDQETTAKVKKEMQMLRADYTLNDWETVGTDRFDYDDGRNVGFQLFPSCMYHPHLNCPTYRQVVPRSVDEHEVHWTFFGYEDDDDQMTRRRLKQANLFGPAGYVTAEDGEVIVRSQPIIASNPNTEQILEMGLGGDKRARTTITESAIRSWYKHYRKVMEF